MNEGQLALALPHRPGLDAADLLPHDGVRLALEMLARGRVWPQDRLGLWGGPGTGKTHLLHVWAREHGATIVAGPLLNEPFWPEGAVAIDDADLAPSEEALLHVLNAAAETGHRLLVTSRLPPARSRIGLPDLASRLRATVAIELGAPDDAMLGALLAKLLSKRQLIVSAAVQRYVLTRLPRTAGAVREAVGRLDAAALAAQSSISRPLAAGCLADLFVADPLEETPS
ncbi:MAG: DnaA/Hda family protein [Acetobacteraceae bacterium]|nr:DnaA/Hda family protein [Acetobacteraceae bacterium]